MPEEKTTQYEQGYVDFVCFLIDNHEKEVITEEHLHLRLDQFIQSRYHKKVESKMPEEKEYSNTRMMSMGLEDFIKKPEEKKVLFNAMKNDLTVEVVREKYNDKCIGKIESISRRKNPDKVDDICFSVYAKSLECVDMKNGYCFGMSPWLSQVTIKIIGN